MKTKFIGISRKIFALQNLPFWIVDFGNQTVATFQYRTGSIQLPDGISPIGRPTTSLPFTQGLNNLQINLTNGEILPLWLGPRDTFSRFVEPTSDARVVDTTVCFDPFASTEDTNIETRTSYGKALNLLLAGTLTVFTVPFPVVNAISSAFKVGGGVRSLWSNENINQLSISPTCEATHPERSQFHSAYLPGGSAYRISLKIPNISINNAPYMKNGQPAAYFWSGLISGTALITTQLGFVKTNITKNF